MELRNTEFFGVYFMKEVGKGPKTCVKLSTMEEEIGTTQTKNGAKRLLLKANLE